LANQLSGTYSGGPKTGRPLGIRRLNSDCLVVADAYLGVFKVDFERGVLEILMEKLYAFSYCDEIVFD
jgi:hypothetical protein